MSGLSPVWGHDEKYYGEHSGTDLFAGSYVQSLLGPRTRMSSAWLDIPCCAFSSWKSSCPLTKKMPPECVRVITVCGERDTGRRPVQVSFSPAPTFPSRGHSCGLHLEVTPPPPRGEVTALRSALRSDIPHVVGVRLWGVRLVILSLEHSALQRR